MRRVEEKQFWVVNVSNKNVSLSDLGLTVHKGRRFNLLDKKHFYYTYEQLKKSAESGSLFKKREMIVVHEFEPPKFSFPMKLEVVKPADKQQLRPLKNPSFKTVEIPVYDELDFADPNDEQSIREAEEQYAFEQAEADLQATAPALAVDKRFKTEEE